MFTPVCICVGVCVRVSVNGLCEWTIIGVGMSVGVYIGVCVFLAELPSLLPPEGCAHTNK